MNIFKFFSQACLSVAILACLFPTLVFAETDGALSSGALSRICNNPGVDATICKEEQKNNQLDSLVVKAVDALMYVVAIVSVGFIVYGGVLYATSSGKSDQVAKAKKTIMGAVIGLAVALLALAVVNFVKSSVDTVTTTEQAQESQD